MTASSESKSGRSAAELEAERARLEERMYWARHEGASEQERKTLERRWNDVRAEQAARKGETWTYKQDRRDDFTFEKTTRFNERGDRIDTYTARGEFHDPATTINWRTDTLYGRRENAIRRGISGGTGDDAGHLIKAEYGADPEGVNAGRIDRRGIDPHTGRPAERLNYGLQNRDMNRGPGWKDVEDGTRELVRGEGGSPHFMEVTSHTISSRDGGEREFHRTMTVKDRGGDPATVTIKQWRYEDGGWVKRDATVTLDRYEAANPHTNLSREKQGIGPSVCPGEGGDLIEANFRERTWTRPEKRAGPKMKM